MAVYIGWAGGIAIYLALAAIPAKLAWDKGYRAWLVWFLFGLLFFLPALLVVICLRRKQQPALTAAG